MINIGVLHSGYKDIIPIGSCICERCHLDHFRKGNYLSQRPVDFKIQYEDIYIEKRTYNQRFNEIISKNPDQIYLVIDSDQENLSGIEDFTKQLILHLRSKNYTKEIVFGGFNEPLEHLNFDEIITIYKKILNGIKGFSNVALSLGEMACNFLDYYSALLNSGIPFKYIGFHSDDYCNLEVLRSFFKLIPSNISLINNEHYHYHGAKRHGYNDPVVVSEFENYTIELLKEPRLKSLYLCCPYTVKNGKYYGWLGYNKVDVSNNKVESSIVWNWLKYLLKGGEQILMLKELKLGDKSEQTRTIQKCLNLNPGTNLIVDGVFGSNTENAVKSFNDDFNIKPNNIVSYQTWLEMLDQPAMYGYIGLLFEILKVKQ